MSDPHAAARFGERMRAALPGAISEAFGGVTESGAATPGAIRQLVDDLGAGHHLHLEIEVSAGHKEDQKLAVILRAEEAIRLFDLEPVDPLTFADPSTQLRLLGEFTEGAEALAGALAAALSSSSVIVSLHVSGASLEEADASAGVAEAALGRAETVACGVTLNRPPGGPISLVLVAPAALAAVLAPASPPAETGTAAAERAANLAARVAARRSAQPDPDPSPPANVTAHPYNFAQLDTPPVGAERSEYGVDLILDVAMHMRVELGSTRMTVEEVLSLGPGSVVELDRLAGEPVDIVVNDRLIARGEVVVVEENFGVRVTEIVSARSRPAAAV